MWLEKLMVVIGYTINMIQQTCIVLSLKMGWVEVAIHIHDTAYPLMRSLALQNYLERHEAPLLLGQGFVCLLSFIDT